MDDGIWARNAGSWLESAEQNIAAVTPPTIAGLGAAEQFALCNIRLWWNSESPCARIMVRNGFVAASLPSAAHTGFEQFMTILATAGQPRPLIHQTTQPDVSTDEARLLSVVALCQQGHNGHAIMVLKRWLPATAYRVGLKNIVAFAGLMAGEGMHLPLRLQVSARDHAGPRYLLH